jgi:hypothetical protein
VRREDRHVAMLVWALFVITDVDVSEVALDMMDGDATPHRRGTY